MFNELYYTLLYYFGTNLLTKGLVQIAIFSYFSVSQKRNIKRNPNGMKPSGELFWNKRDPGDLEWTSRKKRGVHEAGRRASHPRGPLAAPPTSTPTLYIHVRGEKNQREGFIAFYDTEPPPSPNLSRGG